MIAFIENNQAYIALGILLLLFLAFLSERYSPEITAAGAAALFVALGFLDTKEVMGVFSNSAPITIAAMFIISAALVRTGVLEKVSDMVMKTASARPTLAIACFLVLTAAASAVPLGTTGAMAERSPFASPGRSPISATSSPAQSPGHGIAAHFARRSLAQNVDPQSNGPAAAGTMSKE